MKNVRLLLLVDDAGEFRSHCKTALENKGFDVELSFAARTAGSCWRRSGSATPPWC